MTSHSSQQQHPTNNMRVPVVSVPLHLGLFPVLEELQVGDNNADVVESLKDAFTEAERAAPGFTQELLNGIVMKENSTSQEDFTKSLLRMSGQNRQEYALEVKSNSHAVLAAQARSLKVILVRIPDEMNDRPRFLQTIKDIASAIKDLLSAVNMAFRKYESREKKKALELQKKEFVRCSKSFSDTLKNYFRDGSELPVFASANRLIHQANAILLAFKTIPPDNQKKS